MDLATQIIKALEDLAQPDRMRSKSHPTSQDYWHMGIDTPIIRKLAKRLSKAFRLQSWDDQVAVIQHLLDYGSDEAAHLGVFLMAHAIDDVQAVDAPVFDAIVEAFRGWSVTDAFCIEVLQPLLLRFPAAILSLTAVWAQAENRWKRRASVVVFVRKIGASGRYTKQGLQACERLIADSDDLVRKGVGWALKDLMRGDHGTVLAYVEGLRARGVPSVITRYALRDIKGAERQQVLAIKPRTHDGINGGKQ
ncbi:DNA alkylation repair protein [Candidatus Bipolaricaulota bacterium]|nr:DNA alkylation repair protein [Candidatus Bipolaricaulota bacterium]